MSHDDEVAARLNDIYLKLAAAATTGADPFPDRVPGEEFIARLRRHAATRS